MSKEVQAQKEVLNEVPLKQLMQERDLNLPVEVKTSLLELKKIPS